MGNDESERFWEIEDNPVPFFNAQIEEDIGHSVGILIQFPIGDLGLQPTFTEESYRFLFPS